jgi:hypothetical protein
MKSETLSNLIFGSIWCILCTCSLIGAIFYNVNHQFVIAGLSALLAYVSYVDDYLSESVKHYFCKVRRARKIQKAKHR